MESVPVVARMFEQQSNRVNEAQLFMETCLKLDPQNAKAQDLLKTLKGYKSQQGRVGEATNNLASLEEQVRINPTNYQAALDLASAYGQVQDTKRRVTVLQALSDRPDLHAKFLRQLAQQYVQMGNMPRLESTLERLVKLAPVSAEAWYDLAAVKAGLGKSSEALAALKQALDLSAARLKRDPTARDLLKDTRKDARFDPLRQTPEFKNLLPQ